MARLCSCWVTTLYPCHTQAKLLQFLIRSLLLFLENTSATPSNPVLITHIATTYYSVFKFEIFIDIVNVFDHINPVVSFHSQSSTSYQIPVLPFRSASAVISPSVDGGYSPSCLISATVSHERNPFTSQTFHTTYYSSSNWLFIFLDQRQGVVISLNNIFKSQIIA